MLIYTPNITNRIKYTFNLYFKVILGVDIDFTASSEEFIAYQGIKLNYSEQLIDNELFFAADGLLTETNIQTQELKFIDFEDNAAFFPVSNKKSVLPFDAFAAGFFLVSRYEEYLPYIKDLHGRFSAEQSIAHKHYFLKKPMLNIWALKIAAIIKSKYPDFKIAERKFEFIPTIDIDSAYAYKLKGIIRSIGGYLKSLRNLDFKEIIERTKVLSGISRDHFDTFDFQFSLQEKHKLHPVYFILFAEYGDFDKNIPVNNRKFHSLIKMLGDEAEVGIHPSFASNKSIKILKQEIDRLSLVLNRQITKSRQHFLKLEMPHTYRNLIDLDITDDYTMGYASEVGFRASICTAYNFYDLESDTETNLLIHPFAFMEGTLRDYLNIHADRALNYIKPLIDEVKAVNGCFICLWHNESLSNQRRWVGWQEVYEETIKYALK
ncbi:MAG: polysaccharide deacetylase family protein [Bacteroidetes bacterium]|nr:polysaccharide deacetylase family protein [Bacteroidota bacterium]